MQQYNTIKHSLKKTAGYSKDREHKNYGSLYFIIQFMRYIMKLDAGMWRYHANRMDARRSQFDVGRVVAYV